MRIRPSIVLSVLCFTHVTSAELNEPVFTPQSTEAQVKMFGKCCQLRPTGGSSSSLDSSSSCTSETKETKEQGLRFQVKHIWDASEATHEHIACVYFEVKVQWEK